MSCTPPNTDCGCVNTNTSDCVFYKGNYLSCIDVTDGDDLTNILINLNTLICDLPTPSGNAYVGTTDQIDVNGNVISLSNTVLTQLSNNQTDITNLQTCCNASLKKLKTNTPTYVSFNPTTGLPNSNGEVYINFTPAAVPLTQKQGVIDNYTTSVTLTSGYEYTKDFSSYGLKTGDVIKIKGTIRRDNTQTSAQLLTIYDGGFTTNSIIASGGTNGIYTPLLPYSLVDFEFVLTVVSNSSGNLVVKTYANADTYSGSTNTDFYERSTPLGTKVQFITPLTLSVTNVKLAFNSSDEPILEQFIVELIRKI